MNEQKSNNLKVKTDIKAGQDCPFSQKRLNERQQACDSGSHKNCVIIKGYKADHPDCF